MDKALLKASEDVIRLEEENKKLKLKLDKAIEYINNYIPNYDFDHYNLEKLLKILKGENYDSKRNV